MFASICPFIDFCPRDAMSNAVFVVAVCLSSDAKLSCCTKVQLALSLWTSLPQVRGESIALATHCASQVRVSAPWLQAHCAHIRGDPYLPIHHTTFMALRSRLVR